MELFKYPKRFTKFAERFTKKNELNFKTYQ